MLPVPIAFTPSPILHDPELRERFLDALGECGEVSAAAAAVGVPRTSVYKARAMFPEFAHGWAAVLRHRPARGGRPAGTARTDRGWTGAARARFLDRLAQAAQVPAAAAAAGKSVDTAYRLRAADAGFARDWDAAVDRAIDGIEAILFDRALHGVARPVFYGGEKIADVQDYPEALAMFLLRLRRGRVCGGGRAAADVEVATPVVTREDLIERLRAVIARQAALPVPVTIAAPGRDGSPMPE